MKRGVGPVMAGVPRQGSTKERDESGVANGDHESPGGNGAVPLLDRVLESLQQSDARWLVLRGDADTVRRGGDVDLLVAPEDAKTVTAMLAGLGLAHARGPLNAPHQFFVGYDRDARVWLRLDVVRDLGLDPDLKASAALTREVLSRRVAAAQGYRLERDDQFWHQALHLHEGRRRDPRTLLALVAGVAAAGPLAAVAARRLGGHATCLAFIEAIREERFYDAAGFADVLARTSSRQHGRARRLFTRVAHAVGALRRPTGVVTAILGPDGAGKTTLAEGLASTVPLPSRYVYMGVWRAYPWDRYLALVPGSRLASRLARLWWRSVEARYHRSRGRLVLVDRFTYDALLPSSHLDWRGRLTVALVQRASITADLLLVLDAPAEVMFARKGEQGVPELERRRLTYLEVAIGHPHSRVIDATQPLEKVRSDAAEEIGRRLAATWNAAR